MYLWIKLYLEILDDSKMGMLSDHLFRRVIELFLLAGSNNKGGLLPSLTQMAWRLRCDEAALQKDLTALADSTDIIHLTPDGWLVSKFSVRQSPLSSTERVQKFRKKQAPPIVPAGSPPAGPGPVLDDDDPDKNTQVFTDKSIWVQAVPPTIADVEKLLLESAGFVTVPPKEHERIEQLLQLLGTYGYARVKDALVEAAAVWRTTRAKHGAYYQLTNMTWVDWGMEFLMTGNKPWDRSGAVTLDLGDRNRAAALAAVRKNDKQ